MASMRARRSRHRRAPRRAPHLVEVSPDTPLATTRHRMQSAGQALALVIRAGEVVGVVDLEDIRFAQEWAGPTGAVADATTMMVTERAPAPAARDLRPY